MSATATPARQTLEEFLHAFDLMVAAQLDLARRVHEDAIETDNPILNSEDFQDRMTARLPEMIIRECGECTLCCVAPAIPADQIEDKVIPAKAAGEKCQHCTASGCGIYSRRPSVCRGYACLYSLGVTPDRPDNVGVAWTITPVEEDGSLPAAVMIGHCLDIDEVMDDARNRETIRHGLALRMLKAVTVRGTRDACVFLPSGETLETPVNREESLKFSRVTEKFKGTSRWENPLVSSAVREENVTRFANRVPSL